MSAGAAMTEVEKLEQEMKALLEQWRRETDLEKRRMLFGRRCVLKRKWHKIKAPWSVLGE